MSHTQISVMCKFQCNFPGCLSVSKLVMVISVSVLLMTRCLSLRWHGHSEAGDTRGSGASAHPLPTLQTDWDRPPEGSSSVWAPRVWEDHASQGRSTPYHR